MPDQEWLTIAEACRTLKVSRRTMYTYMETGHLRFYRVGGSGHRRIKSQDLEMLMIPGASPNGSSISDSLERAGQYPGTEERAALSAALERAQLELQQCAEDLEAMLPLLVWVGHPCTLCRKPLRGVVKPEVARALLKDFAHRKCLNEREGS